MTTRLDALSEQLKLPLLVTNLINIRYLTGFDSSNAALLVRPKGEATLYTDFRYIEVARRVEGVDVQLTRRSLILDLADKLSGRIQFEADVMPYLQWERLGAGKVTPVSTAGLVEGLRAVKDAEELASIGRAARVADRAFEALTAETWVGRSEKEVAWRLRELLHAHGAHDASFDAIVAWGPNGARPHATPGDTILEVRSLVVVDWGATIDGYSSDCTRTVSTGSPPEQLREAYEVCRRAQQLACDGIKAGITGVEADRLARDPIEEAGFGGEFGHGLGHGVGLEVHEAPRLSTESTDTLEVGNVVTIEPGIYLEGVGGIRIEDLAVVRDHGVELLTSFPKELIEVS
ncbi:MAG TPA: Xaa-Pro peptidase family protein [Gaiellaceae bacterium]|nr:Xaa-Pro peptidase family protein [Gaiellaceae bacterium]